MRASEEARDHGAARALAISLFATLALAGSTAAQPISEIGSETRPVTPAQPRAGATYCVYSITGTRGPLKLGNQICVECVGTDCPFGPSSFDITTTPNAPPAQRVVYGVELVGKCVACPAAARGRTYRSAETPARPPAAAAPVAPPGAGVAPPASQTVPGAGVAPPTSQVPGGQQPVPGPAPKPPEVQPVPPAPPKSPLDQLRENREKAQENFKKADDALKQAKVDRVTGAITEAEYERIKNERQEAKTRMKTAEAVFKQAEKNAKRSAPKQARAGAPPPPPKAVSGEPDVPGLNEPAPDKPPAPGTGTTAPAPSGPGTPGTGQTGAAAPPPPPPGESVGQPSPGEQLSCILPYIVIFRLTAFEDVWGHFGPIGLPERLVLAFAVVAATQYSIIPQEARTALLLFAAGATGILTPAECAFIALGTGQAAGLLGVKWRLEMTAMSPWKGKLTVGLDRTLPNGPIVYSLEEIGRQETRP